jgi:hypothetical protein
MNAAPKSVGQGANIDLHSIATGNFGASDFYKMWLDA